jgi:hypothetical protein
VEEKGNKEGLSLKIGAKWGKIGGPNMINIPVPDTYIEQSKTAVKMVSLWKMYNFLKGGMRFC